MGGEDRPGCGWIGFFLSADRLAYCQAAPPPLGSRASRGWMCGPLSPDSHPGRDRMGGLIQGLKENSFIYSRVKIDMTIRIVTDSSCDLPQEIIRENKVAVIPLFINVGDQSFLDGVDLSHLEFYERLPKFRPAPKTAAPSPEVFRKAFEQLASEGATEILSIHVSTKLSAIVDIARTAAKETTRLPVTVFDSRQLSLGTGFQVLAAARAAAEGRPLSEILSMLEEQIRRTRVFAALDTMEYLRRSGRVNFAISAFGTLLQIKPLMKMYNGEPTAERVRTRKGAMKRLVELLEEHGPYEKVALLHSHARQRAETLLQEVRSLLPAGVIWVEEITPVLGAHIGPGVIGFACISKE
jgi:DegV family protein with EDD domain